MATKLRIDGIPSIWEKEAVDIVVKEHGKTESIFYLKDASGGDAGWAIVVYADPEEAKAAADMIEAQHGFRVNLTANVNAAVALNQPSPEMRAFQPVAPLETGITSETINYISSEHLPRDQWHQLNPEDREARSREKLQKKFELMEMRTADVALSSDSDDDGVDLGHPDDWRRIERHDGRLVFYYNSRLKMSKWTKPGTDADTVARIIRKGENGPVGANLQVFQLPANWNEVNIFQHFSGFGKIVKLKLMRDPTTKRSRRFADIGYETIAACAVARKAMSGFQINTNKLCVMVADGADRDAFEAWEQQNDANEMIKFNKGMQKMNPLVRHSAGSQGSGGQHSRHSGDAHISPGGAAVPANYQFHDPTTGGVSPGGWQDGSPTESTHPPGTSNGNTPSHMGGLTPSFGNGAQTSFGNAAPPAGNPSIEQFRSRLAAMNANRSKPY